MINYDQIKAVHLEISSLCNANCPLCPRNYLGYPHNDGYPEANLTLNTAKQIFSPGFLQQLDLIWINGNFGDIVMNPEAPDIVEYFRLHNPNLKIDISTNGSARNQTFWTRLARAGVTIDFCIDGLEDTHHLYRQNTNWQNILDNAKIFMAAGGIANWRMIKFDHNIHQIDQCKELSKQLGFAKFLLFDTGRDTGPVFDKHGKLQHILGKYQGETNFELLFYKKRTDMVLLEDIIPNIKAAPSITCVAKRDSSIYINSVGEVYPCCWTGFSPSTFGQGEYHQAVNSQIAPLVKNNNALEHGLEECIKWFTGVEESWKKESFADGKLVCCNDNCGFDKYTKLE